MTDENKEQEKDLILLSDLARLMFKCKTEPELNYDDIKDELMALYKKSECSQI